MFDHITTVAVYATDIERAKEFYTGVLKFQITADIPPNLCFLKSESGKINIYLEGGKIPADVNSNSCRLGFFLQTERPASEVFEYLKGKGVKLLGQAPEFVGDDTYCFQFEDPDGNILEVAARP